MAFYTHISSDRACTHPPDRRLVSLAYFFHEGRMRCVRPVVCCLLVQFSVGFRFLSIGDWGEFSVKAISGFMPRYNPEFVLSTGDNFYPLGIQNVEEPPFKDKYEDIFHEDELQVPWYVCAGNHDYYGGIDGVQAEIDYTKKSKRWHFPDHYYKKDIKTEDGTTITLVVLDTWRLYGGDDIIFHDIRNNKGAIRDVALVHKRLEKGEISTSTAAQIFHNYKEMDEEPELTSDEPQLEFVKKALRESTADWKIVMGHYPVYSARNGNGAHGGNPLLMDRLQPILKKYNVDVYFNGHDHSLQHIKRDGIHYFTTAAGARVDGGNCDMEYEGLHKCHYNSLGFMAHEGNRTSLKTKFINEQGVEIYTYTIHKTSPYLHDTFFREQKKSKKWKRKSHTP